MCWPSVLDATVVGHTSGVHEGGAMNFHAVCSPCMVQVPWEWCPLYSPFRFISGGEWRWPLLHRGCSLGPGWGEWRALTRSQRRPDSRPSRKTAGHTFMGASPIAAPHICPSLPALPLSFFPSHSWALGCHCTTLDSTLRLDDPPQTEDQSPTLTTTGVSVVCLHSGMSPPLSFCDQPDLGPKLLTSHPGGTVCMDRCFKVLKLSL